MEAVDDTSHYDVFLSYARENRDLVQELVRVLKGRGLSVWWDRAIRAGRDFEQDIDLALANSKCVLVLWSEHSVASTWVRSEARDAHERDILVPVLVEDARIPLQFRALNTIALMDWPHQPCEPQLQQMFEAVTQTIQRDDHIAPHRKPVIPDDPTLSTRVAGKVLGAMEQTMAGELRNRLDTTLIDLCIDLMGLSKQEIERCQPAHLLRLGDALGAAIVFVLKLENGVFSRVLLKGYMDPLVDSQPGDLDYFLSLTPEQALCIEPPGSADKTMVVFMPQDAEKEKWNGMLQDRLRLYSVAASRQWAVDAGSGE